MPSRGIVAEPQRDVKSPLRTRYACARYALVRVPGVTKQDELPRVEARIRAHVRAAMVENKLSLGDMADRLGEDKGALSTMLRNDGRAPNLWVVYRMQVVFRVKAEDLLNKDPDDEFFRDGVPEPGERRYAPRGQEPTTPPSGASREAAAHPGKRAKNAGGGT